MLGLGLFYGACVGFRRVCLVFGCVGLTRLTRALVLEYYYRRTGGLGVGSDAQSRLCSSDPGT